MQVFQIRCKTVLCVEAENADEAVGVFIEALANGGFSYTAEPVLKEKPYDN